MPVPSEDCLFFGKGNMTDASSGAGIAYPSDHLISPTFSVEVVLLDL